jgi:hypothetical protein
MNLFANILPVFLILASDIGTKLRIGPFKSEFEARREAERLIDFHNDQGHGKESYFIPYHDWVKGRDGYIRWSHIIDISIITEKAE